MKKWGEQGEAGGERLVNHAKNHRKTEHNQIRQGQNPAFTEMYDVSLEVEWPPARIYSMVILWSVYPV